MTREHLQKLVAMMLQTNDDGDIIERYASVEAKNLSPLVLAYIGDAYFHLFVRFRLLSFEQAKVRPLHEFGAQIVSAARQAQAYRDIENILSDEEKDIFRRGRNAKSHAPKSATVAEYHASTGFEALLGALYVAENKKRLDEIAESAFQTIIKEIINDDKSKTP